MSLLTLKVSVQTNVVFLSVLVRAFKNEHIASPHFHLTFLYTVNIQDGGQHASHNRNLSRTKQ